MTRFLLLLLMAPFAMPASAEDTRKRGCDVTAEIVTKAIRMRRDGLSEAKAAGALKRDGADDKYAATVPPLVDWVYSLPQGQLPGGASAYKQACLSQLK